MGAGRSVALVLASVLFASIAGAAYFWCRVRPDATDRAAPRPDPTISGVPATVESTDSPIRLDDVTAAAGIRFVNSRGFTSDRLMPSANGSGVALFDFDQDGCLDIYFLTGNLLPIETQTRLISNVLVRGDSTWRFQDVTELTGLDLASYSHGIECGDYDNDGFPDLYVACYGSNHFYRNNGDGTFNDASVQSGIDEERWSSGAAFLDFDQDGDLDLCVTNYGRWSAEENPRCHFQGRRIFCRPIFIPAEPDALFENLGDGEFRDIAQAAGTWRDDGRGLGVIAADVNDDGLVDLYVANDMSANHLFLNRGGGQFEDASLASGAAYNAEGKEEASMGVDAEDVDGDGLPELFVTNYWMEHNTLYHNHGSGRFQDITNWVGLGATSIPDIGWGTALCDFDNDGWPDIFVANGPLETDFDYEPRSPHRLWHNQGEGKFRLLSSGVGPFFARAGNARGAAFGDVDNDGDVDIVVNNSDDAPALLRNQATTASNGGNARWIRLDLKGRRSNRDVVGAKVEVVSDSRRIVRQQKGGGSYLSASDRRLLIGIGTGTSIDRVTVFWPSGSLTQLDNLAPNRAYEIVESL
jgi:hypothetical protein